MGSPVVRSVPRIRSAGVTDLRHGNVLDEDVALGQQREQRGDEETLDRPHRTDRECYGSSIRTSAVLTFAVRRRAHGKRTCSTR